MPRPRNPDLERWEWPDLPGYMAPFDQKGARHLYAYHYYKGKRRSSGLVWNPSYRDAARKLHMKFVEEIILERAGLIEVMPKAVSAVGTDAPRGVIVAYEQYLASTSHRLSVNGRNKIQQAIHAHFMTDVRLDPDAIHDRLVESMAMKRDDLGGEAYEAGTLKKHLNALKRMFHYCIQRGWIEKNPIEILGVPREEEKEEVGIWEKDEVEAIREKLQEISQSPHKQHMDLFIRWMTLTAMRPGEVLKMQWRHVKPAELTIPKSKTKRGRSIPLEAPINRRRHPKRAAWQKEMRGILEELRRLYDDQQRKTPTWRAGYVWPWKNMDKMNQAFTKSKEALGLREEGRLYDLRATAVDYWVWELGFDLKRTCALAGHSPAVFAKYYERRYGSEDRARMVAM